MILTRHFRRSSLVCMAALAWGTALLPVEPARAQWLVEDASNLTAQNANWLGQWAKQAAQWATEAQNFITTVQHYEQFISNITSLPDQLSSLGNNQQLQPLPSGSSGYNNYLTQKCPGSSGSSLVSNLVGSIFSAGSSNASVMDTMQALCLEEGQLELDEYNRTVAVLNDMSTIDSVVQEIDQLRNAISALNFTGDMSANTNEATRSMFKVNADMSSWQTNIAVDEQAIRVLKQMRSQMAQTALKGSPTVLGSIVQAGTFAAAFNQ